MSVSVVPDATGSLAELLERLGAIAPERIRLYPPPGTATERDVLARPDGVKRLCELVDGVLVEKVMGYYESLLAALLIGYFREFLKDHDLGFVLGADGALRLFPGLVRIPDVSFVSWRKFPDRVLPAEPIPDLVPDLAVEILSEGNTEGEMSRKRREYFSAGVQLVWYVDPKSRSVTVYTDVDRANTVDMSQTLDGSSVLPGFSLSIRYWFEQAGPRRTN